MKNHNQIMKIDIHTHLAYHKIYPEKFLTNMFPFEMNNQIKWIKLFLNDYDGSKQLKQMELAQIDKSVLLIIDAELKFGKAELNIEEIYNLHYKVQQQHPDKFIVFGGIDPRRGIEGFELFKYGIEKLGFKGLKLYPPMGFSPLDNSLIKYYEYCASKSIPVLIHTGDSQPNLHNHFSDPNLIYDVLAKFKKVTFILAHTGYRLYNNKIDKLQEFDNAYFDLSGFQTGLTTDSQLLTNIKNPDKILFGSDWPLFNFMTPISENLKELEKKLSKKDFTNNSLFYNSEKILKSIK